jgi:hypothetical protein
MTRSIPTLPDIRCAVNGQSGHRLIKEGDGVVGIFTYPLFMVRIGWLLKEGLSVPQIDLT